MEFLRHQLDRDGDWHSWLITVARREAWRLHANETAQAGFTAGDSDDLIHEHADPRDAVELRAELRFALDVLATVPERRREVKAMHITGLKGRS